MAKGPQFPAFAHDAPAATIACEVLSALFGDVQTHAPNAIEGEDDEAVHDMRVALRRLRTLLNALGSSFRRKPAQRIGKQLQTLSRALGVVRDADVHLASLRAYRTGSTLRESPGLDWLIERIRDERRAGLVALHSAYLRFNEQFAGTFASAATDEDDASIGARLESLVEKSLSRHVHQGQLTFEDGDVDRLHRFRISGKRLRYVLEVFGPMIGPRANEAYKVLSDVQDDLGQITDANNFVALYTELVDAMPPGDPRRYGLFGLITSRSEARNRALKGVRSRWSGNGVAPYARVLGDLLTPAPA